MNQQKIAQTLGVTQGTVSYWLNGKHYPSPVLLRIIEEKLPELLPKIEAAREKNENNRQNI